ncbi:NADPH-dependent ferric siderophore reductase [Frondihabitans sp. PhB188]|uniref:siderophore-interacting protein n=1 Tax=Frondihabitans sp. PhB188 TaxID=2485200 RepID=UPI000F4919AF|nr:siderophore-interacting protein [Frondihabitans sp. PhB188]ROQ41322.1 NADPH-dependent ferric siderophore reductase [Frondihabitans sp. PhB188]
MLTSTPTRPAHRAFRVSVKRVQRLSPSFVRITFHGDDLVDFGDEGLDQRIKIVLPTEATGYDSFPTSDDWYGEWRQLPDHERNSFRTYTARRIRRAEREVDVDFVSHGDTGPASAWANHAGVGDDMMLIGPDGTSGWTGSGIEWKPAGAATTLLAGDETAVPAISAILEQLPDDARGCAFLEVPTAADILDLTKPAGVDVHWLARDEASYGAPLIDAVRDWTSRYLTATHHGKPIDSATLADVDVDHDILWEVPQGRDLTGEFYAWLAGEAQAIKTLRRFLVSEVGIDRSQVAFMGYWRVGKAEM